MNHLSPDNLSSKNVFSLQMLDAAQPPVHPAGTRAKVLLCSVFGPYAQDDAYGSRSINPMELYHNQVTRGNGPFSLRMFHRSWGLMLLQANIQAPCTLLDFPSRQRFIQELSCCSYDVIGIGAIPPNLGKVREMCELIAKIQPQATVVIGGHVANIADINQRLKADYIVRGEGVEWFRHFLGQSTTQPIQHPLINSGIGARTLGISLNEKPGDTAATLIPSVGCPMGCNFCATSAMFGGKGKHIDFYPTGDELFDVMAGIEKEMKVQSFFVMDENFLLHRKRALRLLELMQQHDKAWSLYVFSSANVLRSYDISQIVGLGISWVWMGLEGQNSKYPKLSGTDTHVLVQTLQSHGIRVLGSTIIGLEEHTPESIDGVIDYAVSHDTEFHQFMLYTPVPGTPLYKEHQAAGTLTDPELKNIADAHGQGYFMHKHPNIPPGDESEYLTRAFARDLQTNGPSIVRMARTLLMGWKRYHQSPDARVQKRIRYDCRDLLTSYAPAVWAVRKWFTKQPKLRARIDAVLKDMYKTLGWKARLIAPLAGRYIHYTIGQEQKRLNAGWSYEPPTFYEKNAAALALSSATKSNPAKTIKLSHASTKDPQIV